MDSFSDQSETDGLGNPLDTFDLGVADGTGADTSTDSTLGTGLTLGSFSLPSLSTSVGGLPLWAWIVGVVLVVRLVKK